MKKTTLIASLTVILIVVLIPLIGNSFMQKMIDRNVKVLNENGLILKTSASDTSYFNTKKHFEFVLQNSNAFTSYLSSYTKTKIPASVNKILSGATIAADVEYSNIPFSKAIIVQIYPLSLSSTVMQEMQKNNPDAYKHFNHFLEEKGFLYHIEYNLISKDFNGFIKDIDESYVVKDKVKIIMNLKGARFEGNGDILAPHKLQFNIKTMQFDAKDGTNTLSLHVNTIRNSSDFESFTKYTSSIKVFHMGLFLKGPQNDINMSIDNLKVSSSSSVKNEKVALYSKIFIKNLAFSSQKINFSLETFNSDISINALDKQSFEHFSELLTKSKTMNKRLLQQEIQKSLLTLLSHGLHVKVSDISLQNIIINKMQALGGLKIQSELEIKKDKDLANKLKISPMLFVSNITMNMKIQLANALYLKILEDSPLAPMIASYAKKDADAVYFDIHLKDTALSVNDKVIR